MPDWPHAPVHRLDASGTYMVTAGTWRKHRFFAGSVRLRYLCERLLALASDYGWQLQAWAVFPNHYHLVALAPADGHSLSAFLRHLHSDSARWVNQLDSAPGRRVWYQYWDTRLRDQKSYLARLSYVYRNPVRHGIAPEATLYPWCSAGWMERAASAAFLKTVKSFPCDLVRVPDEFPVSPEDCR